MKMELASLTPLQVPQVSLPKNRQGEGLATQALYRKTSQLLETLYQMSANAKVVDMKQTKSGRSYTNVPWLSVWGAGGSRAAVSWRELGPRPPSNLRVFPLPRGGTGPSFPPSRRPQQGLLQGRAPACEGSALVPGIPGRSC